MSISVQRRNDPDATRRILATLTEWFGIPAANEHYIVKAATLSSYLAVVDGDVVAVLLIERHFDRAAEVYLIAVDAAHRNRGLGTQLLDVAESDLRSDGVHLLQVKTLGPSRPDENYAQTHIFYQRRGFEPLEELHDLWEGNPCLVMVKTL